MVRSSDGRGSGDRDSSNRNTAGTGKCTTAVLDGLSLLVSVVVTKKKGRKLGGLKFSISIFSTRSSENLQE